MDSVIYTIIGFAFGSATSYFSFKLGSRTYERALEFYTSPTVPVEKEFESDSTPEQMDWDSHDNYVNYGPDEDDKPTA